MAAEAAEKVRLSCPSCGKSLKVSQTAKKARCPGCKTVIDVATALGGVGGSSAPAGDGSAPEGHGAEAPESESIVPDGETGGEGAEMAEEVAMRPSRRISRRVVPVAERKIAGLQPWVVTAPVALVVFVVLWYFDPWWVAVMVAGAFWTYVDSAFMGVTRVVPSSPGYGHAPMVWSAIGFVPFAGPLVYVLLRKKLVQRSFEDYADEKMTLEEMEDQGKIDPPKPLSANMLLAVAVSVLLALVFLKSRPRIEIGTGVIGRDTIVGEDKGGWYDPGNIKVKYALPQGKLLARGPYSYELKALPPKGKEGEPASKSAGSVEVDGTTGSVIFHLTVNEPGWYEVEVKRGDSVLKRKDFGIRGEVSHKATPAP